jgi:hypothetical protein
MARDSRRPVYREAAYRPVPGGRCLNIPELE